MITFFPFFSIIIEPGSKTFEYDMYGSVFFKGGDEPDEKPVVIAYTKRNKSLNSFEKIAADFSSAFYMNLYYQRKQEL